MAGEDERAEPKSPSEATRSPGSDESGASSRASTGSRGTDFPELESSAFSPGDSPEPAERVGDDLGELELAPPEPIVWTPERAGFLLRGAGFALHAADGASSEDVAGAEELWRMTEADLEAMGPPLAAILNRYDAARRLAGLSEEGALAFGLAAYAKRNLAARGRVLAAARAQEEGTVLDETATPWERPAAGDESWREGREGQTPPPPPPTFGDPDPPAGA